MQNILIFAGTTEGRLLTKALCEYSDKFKIFVSVATEYGSEILQDIPYIIINDKRLNCEEIKTYLVKNHIDVVVDATHPYAVDITENVVAACEGSGVKLLRLLRQKQELESNSDIIYVDDVSSAVEFLKGTTGNILLTTGSKELSHYTQIEDYQTRVFARVLPFSSVVKSCEELGFKGKNLICMQGPFPAEFNAQMLKMLDIKYMLTKDSGESGGFYEKVKSASDVGCQTVVIKRPTDESGYSLTEVINILLEGC